LFGFDVAFGVRVFVATNAEVNANVITLASVDSAIAVDVALISTFKMFTLV
jgi:hypothetical protein